MVVAIACCVALGRRQRLPRPVVGLLRERQRL